MRRGLLWDLFRFTRATEYVCGTPDTGRQTDRRTDGASWTKDQDHREIMRILVRIAVNTARRKIMVLGEKTDERDGSKTKITNAARGLTSDSSSPGRPICGKAIIVLPGQSISFFCTFSRAFFPYWLLYHINLTPLSFFYRRFKN